MCTRVGRRLQAIARKRLTSWLRRARQDWRLRRVEAEDIETASLISRSEFESVEIFDDAIKRAADAIDKVILPVFAHGDVRGSINSGDRCAIYSLVRRFQPRRVLEIGTHVGGSTAYIAKALSTDQPGGRLPRLITVDVEDVNDHEVRMWEQCGAQASPRDVLAKLGCSHIVEFVVSSSTKFLERTTGRYDFIFLDGSHEADMIYREIVGSLRLLTPGGCILLHDFFPNGKRLWRDGAVVPGPFLAVRRLRSDGAGVDAIPLGSLPWEDRSLGRILRV